MLQKAHEVNALTSLETLKSMTMKELSNNYTPRYSLYINTPVAPYSNIIDIHTIVSQSSWDMAD